MLGQTDLILCYSGLYSNLGFVGIYLKESIRKMHLVAYMN